MRTEAAVVHLISALTENKESVFIRGFALVGVEDPTSVKFGLSLDEMFEYCLDNNIRTLFFHDFNVEGEFIISYFYNKGFSLVSVVPRYDNKRFSVFSLEGKIYNITALMEGCKRFTFLGSRNLIHASVNDIALAWCNKKVDLNDGIIQIKYDSEINPKLQSDALEYCRCVATAIKKWRSHGYKKITVGGEALQQFQKSHPSWQDDFPILNMQVENKLRLAYRGGLTWLNPLYKNRDIGEGIVIDANAMYASMSTLYPMPYGEALGINDVPQETKRDFMSLWSPENDAKYLNFNDYYFVIEIKVSAYLKYEGIPCISPMDCMEYSDISTFSKSECLNEINELKLYLTQFDFINLIDNYEVYDIELLDVFFFKTKKGMFDNFVTFWYNKKVTTPAGAEREICKLMYESLTGKFGTRTNNLFRSPLYDNGVIKWTPVEKNKQVFKYLPVIVFLTSLARYTLVKEARKNVSRLIYLDTDSLHLSGTKVPDDIVLGNSLGEWKIESTFTKARYLGLKTYIHDDLVDGEVVTTTKMAGIPSYVQRGLNWNTFKSGTVLQGKPIIRSLPGGCWREYTSFKLNL